MNSDLISIIVPIYNVEMYLEKCLDSIKGQTYKNLQVLLVIDGSPDNSIEICKKFIEEDDRFELIVKENGGLASARNAGLDKVKGKYIACIDSDDWISNNMIEKLYTNMVTYKADMSVCSCIREYSGNKKDKKVHSNSIEILNRDEALRYAILPSKYYGLSCTKMYKTNLLSAQRYNEKIFKGEDSPFTCEYILKCKKVVYEDNPLYHYRCDNSSISRSGFSEKKMTVLDSYIGIVKLLTDNNCSKELIELQKAQYANQLLSTLVNINKTNAKKYKKEINYIKKEMNEYKKIYIHDKEIDIVHKIAYIIGMKSDLLFYLFVKLHG